MPSRRAFIATSLALPFAGLIASPARAAIPDFFKIDGMAAGGYDVVAYFAQGDAVPGSSKHALKWKGAIWQFSSAANMAMFEASAWQYAPQYGGYCAFAMAKGAIADSVPKAWTVHDGKLYLNQSKIVRALWKRDIPGFIEAADKVWPDILMG